MAVLDLGNIIRVDGRVPDVLATSHCLDMRRHETEDRPYSSDKTITSPLETLVSHAPITAVTYYVIVPSRRSHPRRSWVASCESCGRTLTVATMICGLLSSLPGRGRLAYSPQSCVDADMVIYDAGTVAIFFLRGSL